MAVTIANELERAVYDILANDVAAARLNVIPFFSSDVCMRVDTTVMADVVRVEIVFYRDNTGDISRRVFFVHA